MTDPDSRSNTILARNAGGIMRDFNGVGVDIYIPVSY
jgi:hypothetical protein